MNPDNRFGLGEVERRKKQLEDAQKPMPVPQDRISRLGQALVNLPWVLLAIAFLVWWLKK